MKVMIWVWNCNMKLKAGRKWNGALCTLTMRVDPTTSMSSVRYRS